MATEPELQTAGLIAGLAITNDYDEGDYGDGLLSDYDIAWYESQ